MSKVRVVHPTKGYRMVEKSVADSAQLKKQGYRKEDVKSEKSTKATK